jgi:MFS family permease
VMIGGWRLLPSRGATEGRRFDVGGMVVLAVLLASLAWGLNRLDASDLVASLGSLDVWPLLVLGVVLVAVFVVVERRAADPVIRPGLLRSRQVALACGLSLGAGLTEAAIVFVPALLVAEFAVTTSKASFMLLPIVLAMAVGAPAFGRWMDRVGSRVVVIAGSLLIAAGLFMVALFPPMVWLFYAAGTVIGLGVSALLGSALRYVMLHAAPPSERGAAQGLLTVFTSVGQLVGSAVVGGVIASHVGTEGYAVAFIMVGVVMAVLAILSLGLRSRAVELAAMEEGS